MTETGLAASAAMLAATLLAPGADAIGDPARGARKAEICFGCHAIPGYTNVYPSYRVPKLGGQHPEYIVAALEAYRDRRRSHATMRAQASSLSDQDMADIAAYFAGQR